jgi:hypothetical protein
MTAYDVAAWTDFANTVAGGAAALAAEIGMLGLATTVGVIVALRAQRSGEHPVRAMTSTLLLGVPALLLLAAAVSLWIQCGGGLYWVTAAVTTGFVSATANAWVLLVEIRR